MKVVKSFVAIIFIVIVFSCSKSLEPTSPNNTEIVLNKENDSALVSLQFKGQATINNDLTILFDGVKADSRCPENANCVWAGDGEIKLIILKGNSKEEVSLHTFLEPKEITFGGYRLFLKALKPYPTTTTSIKPEDYVIDLIVAKSSVETAKTIRLIEGVDYPAIKKDMLNVNNISLNKDELTINVGYSGGCRVHKIELFAQKEIQKSNPAQVTLLLSHDADGDACKALISSNEIFDLTPLKEYLKEHFNIQDKVLLLLFDPSGRPVQNPVIEYNLQ